VAAGGEDSDIASRQNAAFSNTHITDGESKPGTANKPTRLGDLSNIGDVLKLCHVLLERD
jgi:hypothetical protein